jgi:hypothetical protein
VTDDEGYPGYGINFWGDIAISFVANSTLETVASLSPVHGAQFSKIGGPAFSVLIGSVAVADAIKGGNPSHVAVEISGVISGVGFGAFGAWFGGGVSSSVTGAIAGGAGGPVSFVVGAIVGGLAFGVLGQGGTKKLVESILDGGGDPFDLPWDPGSGVPQIYGGWGGSDGDESSSDVDRPSLSYGDTIGSSGDLSGWEVDPNDYRTGSTVGGFDGTGPVDRDGDGNVDGYNWGGGTVQPVIIDLDRDGIEVSAGSKASFDFDGDGYRESGAWAGADDGFLVLDRQDDGTTTANTDGTFGDGKITRADELVLSLLTGAPDDTDLQAVKSSWLNNLRADAPDSLDASVQERILNRYDRGWAHLRVWQDLDRSA